MTHTAYNFPCLTGHKNQAKESVSDLQLLDIWHAQQCFHCMTYWPFSSRSGADEMTRKFHYKDHSSIATKVYPTSVLFTSFTELKACIKERTMYSSIAQNRPIDTHIYTHKDCQISTNSRIP